MRCFNCGETKTLEDFAPSWWRPKKGRKSGQCRACKAAENVRYKSKRRGEIAAQNRAYRTKNRDRLKLYEHERQKRPARQEPRGSRTNWKKKPLSNEAKLLSYARARAKEKKLVCSITVADIVIPERCPLLGVLLQAGSADAPSVDRMDNTKGYIAGNVWVVSKRANTCKGTLTADDLIKIGRRLKAHMTA